MKPTVNIDLEDYLELNRLRDALLQNKDFAISYCNGRTIIIKKDEGVMLLNNEIELLKEQMDKFQRSERFWREKYITVFPKKWYQIWK